MAQAYSSHNAAAASTSAAAAGKAATGTAPAAADSSAASGPAASTPPPPRLSSVSADFAVWSSLTGELLRLLSGQWAAVFSDLPNTAQQHSSATNTPTAATAHASSQPHAPPSRASARAMWDLVSLLLSHATASAAHTPHDEQSAQASEQLDALVAELRPLLRHYLTVTYQLDGDKAAAGGGSGEQKEAVEPAASSSAAPPTAAQVVAANGSGAVPRLLPLPHASLLFACSVLLPSDDATLPAAQAAHRQSEERVRAFIAAKQARLSLHYHNGHSRQRPAQHHAQSHHATGAARGHNTRLGAQQSSGYPGYNPQRHAALQQQPQPQQQQRMQAAAQQPAVKSQPGSYAFAAAGRA